MRCNRCHKRLKKAYIHKGQVYGPECIKKKGGIALKSKSVKIKEAENKDDKQYELF